MWMKLWRKLFGLKWSKCLKIGRTERLSVIPLRFFWTRSRLPAWCLCDVRLGGVLCRYRSFISNRRKFCKELAASALFLKPAWNHTKSEADGCFNAVKFPHHKEDVVPTCWDWGNWIVVACCSHLSTKAGCLPDSHVWFPAILGGNRRRCASDRYVNNDSVATCIWNSNGDGYDCDYNNSNIYDHCFCSAF